MNRFWISVIMCFVSFSSAVNASTVLETGLSLGQPTGVSAKYWISNIRAFQFGLGWSLETGNKFIAGQADLLWHNYDFLPMEVEFGKLPIYYGVGLYGRLSRNIELGVRVPVGMEWLIRGVPVSLFLESVPSVKLLPSISINFQSAIGIRYLLQI